MIKRICTSPRILVLTAALAGGTLAGPLSTLDAHAAYTVCRGDPIVMLSNGYQLKIVESVADTSSDIKNIGYTVHVPQGLGVQKIVYTGGPLKGKETVTVFADSAAGSFTTASVVTTGKAGVSASMTSTLADPHGAPLTSGSASGTSGKALTVQLQHA